MDFRCQTKVIAVSVALLVVTDHSKIKLMKENNQTILT